MEQRDSLATLPNLISLSRLGLAAAFVFLQQPRQRLAILAAAALTDILDGYFARLRGSSTKWGALIDPIADRFFIFTAVCTLLFDGVLNTWQYAVLISRDFMTAVGFLTARAIPWLRPVEFKSRRPGKLVTVLQFTALVTLYLSPERVNVAFLGVALVSAYAIADYTFALWRARAVR